MAGYVKLDRRILEWEWYSDANTSRVFLHLLLKANWKPGRFKGVEIPRGSLVASLNKLAEELKLTIRNVRTAIKHLISTGEVTQCCHAKFTVFTIKNYDAYQLGDTVNDRQVTTIEEYKNNNKKEYKDIVLQAEPSDDVFDKDPYRDVCWDDESCVESNDVIQAESFERFLETGIMPYAPEVNKTAENETDQRCPYEEVTGYLNQRTGKRFKSTSKVIRKYLRRRFDEDFTLDDVKKVIDIKTEEWKGTKMDKYLRPSTLFGDNFEAYLNQEPAHVHADHARAVTKKGHFGTKNNYSGTKFNNFDQRQYDFDLLELQLLAVQSQLLGACPGTQVPAMA